jgi:hypothetical protein
MAALYSHWSDELARLATIAVDIGEAEDSYGVDRLVDDNPAYLFKATGTSVALEFAHPEKQPIGLLALIHTTLEATDDVRLQGDDDADWYNPAFDMAITPSGWVGAGVTRWPVNTWENVLAADGYAPAGYNYHRLTFGLDTPLAQPLQIGEIRMHPVVRSMLIDRGRLETRSKPRILNKTAFQVATIYTRGTTLWKAQLGLSALLDDFHGVNERAAIQALWDDVDGGNLPFLFVPNENELPVYEVRWSSTDEQIQRVVEGASARAGVLEEVGRGLRPGV